MRKTKLKPPESKSIGPHEGRELELMLDGKKPLSMFSYLVEGGFVPYPEAEFEKYVSTGRLKKVVSDQSTTVRGELLTNRRVLYALPNEDWRIRAFLFVQALYDSFGPGWRPDFEMIIGSLLGYDREDIEAFINLRIQESDARARPI